METNEVVKELATKITIPKGIQEAIYSKLFKNLWIAVVMILYFIFVNLGYIKLSPVVFESDLHVFAGILIILTIVCFEIGYRKDSFDMSLYGTELLFLSIVTLFMPYIYFHRGPVLKFTYSFVAVYILIYYLGKCLFVYISEVKKYKSGMSDIKEIIDDEDEDYLDIPNERKFRLDDEEDVDKKASIDDMMEKEKIVSEKPKKTTNIKKKIVDKGTKKKESTKKKVVEKNTEEKNDVKASSKKTTKKKESTVKK